MSLRPLAVLPFLFATALAQSPLPDATAEAIAKEGIDNSQVMRLLRDLTGKVGHRLTGSDNFTKGCEWAKGEFERMGLQVELEKWAEWKLAWNRGAWVGRIVHPFRLDMYVATEAWTAGTKGLQQGDLVLEPDWRAETLPPLAGKWVVTRIHAELGADGKRLGRRERDNLRAERAKKVGAAGAFGLVYRAEDPDDDFPIRVRVFGNHNTAMLALADAPTTPEIAVRADHFDLLAGMLDKQKAVRCEFDIQNAFREGPIALHNVIATLPGTEKPEEWVVVSSHLDSWHQAQGTTANGTGTTTTMEAARILTAVGAKPKRSIKFCLWGGEEEGLLGSQGFVKQHRTEMPKVSAAFNHDTGTNWAQSISLTRPMAEQLAPVFAQVNRLLKAPDADWQGEVFKVNPVDAIGGGGGGSDHASFLAAGVPGLNWGLKGRSNYFRHTWHTQWDTIDVAIEEYQRHTATIIAMAALGTANLPTLLDRQNVGGSGGGPGQSAMFANALFGAEIDGFTFKAVQPDGVAAKAGVKNGDVLKKVAGKPLESMRQIFQFAREVEGDTVTFTFQRGDATFDAVLKKEALRGNRDRGNQAPRDTVAPGGGQRPGNPGNPGGGGEDREPSWGVGVSTDAGVQGRVAFRKADFVTSPK